MTNERGAAYQEKVRMAVIRAIMEQSGVDLENGERACLIGVADVCAVLTDLMAGFFASAPECATPAGVRQIADIWRKAFHLRLKAHVASPSRDIPTMGGILN